MAAAREADIIPLWSPEHQVRVALDASEPHQYEREILEALANVESVTSLVAELDALRTSRWLTARDRPVAPDSILDLPDDVWREARALERRGLIRSFVCQHDLSGDVRDHPGFPKLKSRVLLLRSASWVRLGDLLDETSVVARLGSADDYPLADFRSLAHEPGSLQLPGWPLLGAVLRSTKGNAVANMIVRQLSSVAQAHPSMAVRHLNALAAVSGSAPAPALAAAKHAFRALSQWGEPSRKAVFREACVPTQAGDWRIGREVVGDGTGLTRSFVLHAECARILELYGQPKPFSDSDTDDDPAPPSSLGGDPVRIGYRRLADLERRALRMQADFLARWFGLIPDRLVVVYLALLGSRASLGKLVEGRAPGSNVATWWDETRAKLNLGKEHRLLLDVYSAPTVRVVSLAGIVVDVPPAAGAKHLLFGNDHRVGTRYLTPDGRERCFFEGRIRKEDIPDKSTDRADVIRAFRRFVETVAVDCVRLRKAVDRQTLGSLLDGAIKVSRTTLRDTVLLMQDELHGTLSTLKPEADSVVGRALASFRDRRDRALGLGKSPSEIAKLKAELWDAVQTPDAKAELLTLVRRKIREYGYSPGQIVFELLQNADDAWGQVVGGSDEHSCFGLKTASGGKGFLVKHWGRPINDYGHPPDGGRRRGYGRDLYNMLLMGFSEKRPGKDVTGRFGLGFKAVHMLSDRVGIASGSLAVRIHGGLIPGPWPKGEPAGDDFMRYGQEATVVAVPFAPGQRDKGREAVEAFRRVAVWLPLFLKHVRRIELVDGNTTIVASRDRSGEEEIADGLRVTTVVGPVTERVLSIDLGGDFRLALRLDGGGPAQFPDELPRLWNLAPLREASDAGCLLNGPFRLEPGRGRLADTDEDVRALMEDRGAAYGVRLQRLYEKADADWGAFCKALALEPRTDGQYDFWSRLFDVVTKDLADSRARHLHAVDRGYGLLAARCPVVPTRLPDPRGGLVNAKSVSHRTAGALDAEEAQKAILAWPAVKNLPGSVVARPVADQLRRLGFGPISELSVAEALRLQLNRSVRTLLRRRSLWSRIADRAGGSRSTDATSRGVDAALASSIGKVINPESIERAPLDRERSAILGMARTARFRCRDGGWRPVREVGAMLDGDESLLCAFAPDDAVLDASYDADGLEFFKVARQQSGYRPQAGDLYRWAVRAKDVDRQRGVLRYLVAGRQRDALAKAIRGRPPSWLPGVAELGASGLVADWSAEDRVKLAAMLTPSATEVAPPKPPSPPPPPPPPPPSHAKAFLQRLHKWWSTDGASERRGYQNLAYPREFALFPFQDSQEYWFTLFAIARFQGFGRVKDEQNREFIDRAWRDGWWQDLAFADEKEFRDKVAVDRLDAWSDPHNYDREYRLWRNALVDLYTISRGLKEYIAVMRRLPQILRQEGRISLRQLLDPSLPAIHGPLGSNAAPIDSAIGIGINWMIRELVRHGFHGQERAKLLFPYCWSPTRRVRELLRDLGLDLRTEPDMDDTTRIWDFVQRHLGNEEARFGGDFDLPLQLITLSKHTPLLDRFRRGSGAGPLQPGAPRWFR